MNDQIPLYLGIPLAVLCVAVAFFVVAFVTWIWKDSRQ